MNGKIDKLPMCDLERQKIVKVHEHYIILDENRNFFCWRAKFTAEEWKSDDEMLGKENVENDFTVIVPFKNISAIEKIKCSDSILWKVIVSISGKNDDVKLYFKDEKSTQEIFEKIQKWLVQ